MSKPWKAVTSEEDLDKISVVLVPRLGVDPMVYVPVLWGLLMLGVLFLVLLFPGIRSYGSVVTVESSPSGAQVLVDGVLRGSTPVEIFVVAGRRKFDVRLAGLPTERYELDVAGRRLGSRIVPRRESIVAVFDHPDIAAVRAETVVDFSAWSLGTEPGPQFQHPPTARDGARRMWADSRATNATDGAAPVDESFMRDLLAHAQQFQRSDLLGALLRVSNLGGVFHTGAIAEIAHNFIQLDNNYRSLHRIADALVGTDEADLGDWYRTRQDRLSTELLVVSVALDEGRIPAVNRRTIQDQEFVAVPPGHYAIGYPLRDEERTGVLVEYPSTFWIQSSEVSRRSFARFILDRPEWAPENNDREDYLRDWPVDWHRWADDDADPEAGLPVRYVPRDAAVAYARWLQERTVLDGETIRLPSAAEWEYAAFLNDPGTGEPSRGRLIPVDDLPRGGLGAHLLAGNVWEWTTDWYGRFSHIMSPEHGTLATITGGSFVNTDSAHFLRGGQDPDRASPFLGFRLVIVQDQGE